MAPDFSPATIFISYSRSDGRGFAEAFEQRLGEEADIRSWRDLKSIEGGEDIRPQVLRAIEAVKHLVLILSQRALASDWVKCEWTHARMVGRKVSPVLADPAIKRSDLPGWARRADVYDISEPERWAMLVQVLKGPGETRRVPYMAGDLPEDFVPRPAEYTALKEAVLSARSGTAVGVTTALRGAGGYGKTTLANYLCRDPEVRFEFTDGILRSAPLSPPPAPASSPPRSAILPEDQNVPLAVVVGLWAETGALDEDQSEELVQRFHALSLLQGLDLGARTLRLHDNMIWYLRESLGAEGCSAAHAAMVRAASTSKLPGAVPVEADRGRLRGMAQPALRSRAFRERRAGPDGEALPLRDTLPTKRGGSVDRLQSLSGLRMRLVRQLWPNVPSKPGAAPRRSASS